MLVQILIFFIFTLFALGIIINVLREDWSSKYLTFVTFLIALPIAAVVFTGLIAYKLICFCWNRLWIVFKAAGKAVVLFLSMVIFAILFGLTFFVPYIGSAVQRLNYRLEQSIDSSGLNEECRFARGMLVEIVTELEEPIPEFEDESQYRDELVRVKERGKQMLSVGESVLSLFLGGLLITSQVYGFSMFQSIVYGFTAAIAIQLGLFAIAVSILYRVSILEFLAYGGDEEFSSINEMDVALSYQKAVSKVELAQLAMIMIILVMRLINTDRETVRAVLRAYYREKSIVDAMRFARKEISKENSGTDYISE